MMKAIIAADPDGTGVGGLTASDKNLVGGIVMPYASPIVEENGAAFKWVETEDGTFKPAYFTEDVVAGFQLARDMYESGVIERISHLQQTSLPRRNSCREKAQPL